MPLVLDRSRIAAARSATRRQPNHTMAAAWRALLPLLLLWLGTAATPAAAAEEPGTSRRVLYAGGAFATVDGLFAGNIARFDGTAWGPLGSGTSSVTGYASVSAVLQMAGRIFVGGYFDSPAPGLAQWDGTAWSGVGTPFHSPTDVRALAAYNGGLAAGGYIGFPPDVGLVVMGVAFWDGLSWHALGDGLNGMVASLAASGTWLFAAGDFTASGSYVTLDGGVAAWNGEQWTAMAGGVAVTAGLPGADAILTALRMQPDGRLAVCGYFDRAGSVSAQGVAFWDIETSSWSAVAEEGAELGDAIVNDVTTWVDGSLVVAGIFMSGDGPTASPRLWDGTAWQPLGNVEGQLGMSLAVMDNALYLGGMFWTAGGASITGLASWDGSEWSPGPYIENDPSMGVGVAALLAGCQPGWALPDCQLCDRGHVGKDCTPCPLNTYADAVGSTECLACPAGTATSSVGSFSLTQCHVVCDVNMYLGPSGTCVGAYAAATRTARWPLSLMQAGLSPLLSVGGRPRSACPEGSTTAAPGATSITQCICAEPLVGIFNGECGTYFPQPFFLQLNGRACAEGPRQPSTRGGT